MLDGNIILSVAKAMELLTASGIAGTARSPIGEVSG